MWIIEILLPAGLDMHVKNSEEEEVKRIFREKVFELIERFNDLDCKEYEDYLEIHNLIKLGNYKEAQDCFNDINEFNEEFDTYIYMYSSNVDDMNKIINKKDEKEVARCNCRVCKEYNNWAIDGLCKFLS